MEDGTCRRARTARKALKLTQQQVADDAGVALGTIQSFEAGKRTPQPENLAAILRVLKLDDQTPALEEWPKEIQTTLDAVGEWLAAMDPPMREAKARELFRWIFGPTHEGQHVEAGPSY